MSEDDTADEQASRSFTRGGADPDPRSGSPRARARSGAPQEERADLRERMARVEAKQDHTVEKIDGLAESIEENVLAVQDDLDDVLPQHRRLWLTWQAAKWAAGGTAVSAAVLSLTGVV